ncbi:MAG: hypothetical protein JO081_17895 [Alphaproteobacteria bacterium]|nr:hypothetical protein [Alphaproteobacteria bacterium]
MSDEKVVDLHFFREARNPQPERNPDDGNGGGGPPGAPPGGSGPTPEPPFGSEDMLSEELSKDLGDDWICAWPIRQWYRWDGARWDNRQGDYLVRQRAQVIARRIAAMARDKRLARQICRKGSVSAAIDFASSNERHARYEGNLDNEGAWEINTPQGLLFLKTGFLAPPMRSRLLTRLAGAAPSPEMECPRWLQFLDEATGGDVEMIDYLQRLAGYCLTGDVSEHAIFFLYGKSRTGKTVFLTMLLKLLGDYAIHAAVDMFVQSDGQRHLTEVMDLDGPRLVIAPETPEGKRWNDSLLKQIAGGEQLRANRMRQDPVQFTPVCKLGLGGNHRPRMRAGDDGMRTRFRVLPFRHRQPVLDKDLVDKLAAELPGIFKWALIGEMKRIKDGKNLSVERAPAAIKEATDEYFEAEDMIKRWLDSCCLFGKDYKAVTDDLYKSFRAWAERIGERYPPTINVFSQRLGQLDELGIQPWRGNHQRGFLGVQLTRSQPDLGV